jgi:hypothetical protein
VLRVRRDTDAGAVHDRHPRRDLRRSDRRHGRSLTDPSLPCLYLGGGHSAVPWPATIPDTGVSILKATCTGPDVLLSGSTAAETGNIRTCTSAGCLYGAPVPIPNTATPILSTCVTDNVVAEATGSLVCSTGVVSYDVPLVSDTRLFGDLWTGKCAGGANAGKPCGLFTVVAQCPGSSCSAADVCVGGGSEGGACTSDADCPDGFCSVGVQPCPICAADSASGTGYTCHGGTNDGGSCQPGSTDIGGRATRSRRATTAR